MDAFKNLAKAAATPSTSPPDGLPVGGLRKTLVDVGAGGKLVFNPQNISSLVGEKIVFNFNPKVGTRTLSVNIVLIQAEPFRRSVQL